MLTYQQLMGRCAARGARGTGPRVIVTAALAALIALIVVQPVDAQQAARTPPPSPLEEARRLYNLGRYEEAIAAATRARDQPGARHQALLLFGRAGLERYRQTADRADLVAAREALRGVDASQLEPRDRLELIVGLGEALFLDEAFGPAAEVFDSIITQSAELGSAARDQLLDWWATAMDRQAQTRAPADRTAMYNQIISQMKEELRRDPGTAAASYWVAAAARANGDLDHAWDAAMAGWVRAQLTRDQGAALRPDLDRLMLQGIIPERARKIAASPAELDQVIGKLAAEWDSFKEKWLPSRSVSD